MRNIIVTAIAAFALGGITTGVLIAHAQPAAPPAGAAEGPPNGFRGHRNWLDRQGMGPGAGPVAMGPGAERAGMDRPDMERWQGRMRQHWAQRREMMRTFALIDRPEDRKLTPPDVRKIAEAFLLWNGNHTWRIINEKAEADRITFDLATAEGSVIARFSMDPKTGHLAREG